MCWISTATLVLCWEKNPRCWLSCRWHAREKVNCCCALFQIPGDVQAYFLSDLWGELKKLKWHMRYALRSLFSATCKHQLMPWWLECGKFGSGREKAARGSSQSGGKKKKKKEKKETVWNAAKAWNEQFLSPPSLKCHTSLPLSLFFHASVFHHFPLSLLHFYFPYPLTVLPTLLMWVSTCSSVLRLNILILDHFRCPPLSQTDTFSQQRKSGKPVECKVNVFNWPHPSKCILKR